MQGVILAIAIFIILLYYKIMDDEKRKVANEIRIKKTFGKKRDDFEKQRMEFIRTFYLCNKKDLEEHELVDDITWNDLG